MSEEMRALLERMRERNKTPLPVACPVCLDDGAITLERPYIARGRRIEHMRTVWAYRCSCAIGASKYPRLPLAPSLR